MAGHDLNTKIPPAGRKLVLAGNPNVGKSVFFNALTGLYVDVANYPGTTLDMACGRVGSDVVIDTPGVYGLSSLSEEERMARDIFLAADVIINVVDAVHLERDLFLTLQLIDMGFPMVVALNMVDEAAKAGVKIKVALLEKLLGVPVVPVVAVRGTGIEELKAKVRAARPGNADPKITEMLASAPWELNRAEAVLVLEGDREVAERCGVEPGRYRQEIYQNRRERANSIVAAVTRRTGTEAPFSRLSRWMVQPLTGFPLLVLTLFLIYELVGVFIAGKVVDFTFSAMNDYYEPLVRTLVNSVLPGDSFAAKILTGQFGLLTLTVSYIIGLLFPLVLGIFLVLSLLEDSGYLPRIAALVDRLFCSIGLNGQAVIPLILGFGCVTMALITTRLLNTDRERQITTVLLALGVPCSAQAAIAAAVLGSMGAIYLIMYGLFILSAVLIVGVVLENLLPGRPLPLLIELPPLRLPSGRNVLKKTWLRSLNFVKEATPFFVGGMLLLGFLEAFGLLQVLRDFLCPLTVNWLHLPPEIADVFIVGLIRKEFGAAFVLSVPMLPLQKFIVVLTLTLTVPCIASTMVIFKERGLREGAVIWSGILAFAFITGGLVTRLMEAFSKTGHTLFWGTALALAAVTFVLMFLLKLFFGKGVFFCR